MEENFKISHHNNRILHFTVGALIEQDGKYLLIDRALPPLGFACVAGHIDEGEEPINAVKREIKEESNLDAKEVTLVDEETLDWNWCSKGATQHHWCIYKCKVNGKIKRNEESKSIGWFYPEEIRTLKLEPSWEYWFKKLKII